MSTSERMLKLMAYADGELEGAELEEVEGWLTHDASAARLANELAELGDLVQLGRRDSAEAKKVASFDVADLVMAEIAKPSTAGNVSSIDTARARRQRNVKVGTAVAAALALAASVFLVNRSRDEQPMAQVPIQAAPQSQNTNGSGIDIDVVETPGHSVSVFYLPNETKSATTSVIVWVDESGGE